MEARLIINFARHFAQKLKQDESGQAVTEYILILSLALGGAVAISRGIIAVIDKFTLTFGAQLEKDLKAGRAPSGIWSN